MSKELCKFCDQETGRAGRADDSIFDHCNDNGPYCEQCFVAHIDKCTNCRINLSIVIREYEDE